MIVYDILNPDFFLQNISLIGEIIDEGFIEFDRGMRLVGIDPGRICLFELIMGEDTIHVVEDEKISAPLSFSDLVKITNRFKHPDTLRLMFSEKDNLMKIIGKIGDKKKTFRLRTIEADDNEMKDKDLTELSRTLPLNTIFKVNTKDFLEGVEDVMVLYDCFDIEAFDNSIMISAASINGDCSLEIKTGEIYSLEKSSYNCNFIAKILKKLPSKDIIIMYGKDYPIAIHDKISEKSKMIYMLAPRIEHGDD